MKLETLEAGNTIKNKMDAFHWCIEQLDGVLGFQVTEAGQLRNGGIVGLVMTDLLRTDPLLFDDAVKQLQEHFRYQYAKQLSKLQSLTDETANP